MWRIALVLLLVAGCARAPLPARPGAGPNVHLPADQAVIIPVPPSPRRFTQGEVLYIRHCADCHGWTGHGDGPLAAVLETKPRNLRRAELFTGHSEAELVAWILHGKELAVPIDPTAVPHTEAEVTALLTHLQRLPTLSWEQIDAGEKVYDSLCAACHGIYGRGDGRAAATLPFPPRDLSTPPYQSQGSDEELLRIISEGKGAMPGAVDVLSAKELKAVVAFVRILSPGYELYDRFCAVCHGPDGRAPTVAPQDSFGFDLVFQRLPTFDEKYFRTHTTEQVRAEIQHMRKQSRTAMPHFAGELNAEEARQILTYLRTLPPES
ncbi:MAG: c-type cytochrome [Deltaproteobacteria bacterium]|nr:c-type cytochrome [Deltaproteobacteria bacterium]